MWLQHLNFKKTGKLWWKTHSITGSQDCIFLKMLQSNLKEWNQPVFGNVDADTLGHRSTPRVGSQFELGWEVPWETIKSD